MTVRVGHQQQLQQTLDRTATYIEREKDIHAAHLECHEAGSSGVAMCVRDGENMLLFKLLLL